MRYSRENPSPQYKKLIEQYKLMHTLTYTHAVHGTEQMFCGGCLRRHIMKIKEHIDKTASKTLLDYGSGKGYYHKKKILLLKSNTSFLLKNFLKLKKIVCYDPAYPPFCELPKNKFDGVISTDVLEHIPENDIDWVLDEIFSFANYFVYIHVCCFPSSKTFPSGENVHCTIKSTKWWRKKIDETSKKYPEVNWELSTAEQASPKSMDIVYFSKTSTSY